MKKFLILSAAFLFLNLYSDAQVIIVGGKGIVNGCRLQNKTVSDAGDAMKYDFTWGFAGGAYLRYYFNEATYYSTTNISLCIEALYNGYGQKYSGSSFAADTLVSTFNQRIRIKSLDIPIMIHAQGQAGLYGELGVSFGMISGVTADRSQDPAGLDTLNYTGRSLNSSFSSSNLSAIFGFGIDSELSEHVNFTAGLRLTYGITDLTKPQKDLYPQGYNETHSATIGIVIGFGYILNFYHDYH
jgi:hypothetical protein